MRRLVLPARCQVGGFLPQITAIRHRPDPPARVQVHLFPRRFRAMWHRPNAAPGIPAIRVLSPIRPVLPPDPPPPLPVARVPPQVGSVGRRPNPPALFPLRGSPRPISVRHRRDLLAVPRIPPRARTVRRRADIPVWPPGMGSLRMRQVRQRAEVPVPVVPSKNRFVPRLTDFLVPMPRFPAVAVANSPTFGLRRMPVRWTRFRWTDTNPAFRRRICPLSPLGSPRRPLQASRRPLRRPACRRAVLFR